MDRALRVVHARSTRRPPAATAAPGSASRSPSGWSSSWADEVGGERAGRGIDVPHQLAADAADVPARIAPTSALPQLAGKRVLVVDDNATNREILSRQVRSWGMEPVAAALPSEALALIEQGSTSTSPSWTCRCQRWTGSRSPARSGATATRRPPAGAADLARPLPRRVARTSRVQLAKPVKAVAALRRARRACSRGRHRARAATGEPRRAGTPTSRRCACCWPRTTP